MDGQGSIDFAQLLQLAATAGEALRRRGDTVAVAESSAGGLISAALLAVPGASAYFRGGAVVYTLDAKAAFLQLDHGELTEPRAATAGHARVLASGVRGRLGTTWGVGETGATGPTGNRYGDPPGHACLAVAGPVERALTVETGHGEREANMLAFAAAGFRLLLEAMEQGER
jgi:nicotinamide-nucleotide amidase